MSSKSCPKCGIVRDVTELNEGQVVPIWMRRENGEEYLEFYGRLIRHISSDTEPYPFALKCPKCRKQVNVITEKWEVSRVDDKFFQDITYIRNVRKFHSLGVFAINTYSDSESAMILRGYCVDYLENDPCLCAKLKREVQGKDKGTELLRAYNKYLRKR